MQKILPQVYHWTTFHEGIRQDVHSYCYVGPKFSVLIDPMVPADGLDWFREHAKPEHICLTNRLHYRGCAEFAKAFGATAWCHSAGLHEFTPEQNVRGFEHGDELPGGVRALKVGSLCPEETALLLPPETSALALGDAVIRENDALEFVPDELMGDDPVQVKRGLKAALEALFDQPFDHLLLAHGSPWLGGGKKALKKLVGSKKKAAGI